MKQILTTLLMTFAVFAYAQKKDLVTVNSVKPKKGQKMAFEAAYKQHVAKFHKADEKISVYEILTGDHQGTYLLVNSGISYADFDTDRSDATAHNIDLDKTFFPFLEETKNATYRYVDTLSMRPEVEAVSFQVTVTHLKQGINMGDYYRERFRSVKIWVMLKGEFWESLSVAFFDQQWDGSQQVTVSTRKLKDGFKSLEQGYYKVNPTGTTTFRDEYVKLYGYDAWDARIKVLDNAVEKSEVYLMKLRKDLSSQ